MPQYFPNQFHWAMPAGKALSDVATALMSGPTRYQRDQQQAQTRYYGSMADKAGAEADLTRAKLGAPQSIADAFMSMLPKAAPAPMAAPAMAPEPMAAPGGLNIDDLLGTAPAAPAMPAAPAAPPVIDGIRNAMPALAAALARTGDTKDIGTILRAVVANLGASGPDISNAMLGAGDAYGSTPTGAIAVEQAKPVDVGAGALVYGAPGDPRFAGGKPLIGRNTKSTVEGELLNALIPRLSGEELKQTVGARIKPDSSPLAGLNIETPDGTVVSFGSPTKSTQNKLQATELSRGRFSSLLNFTRGLADDPSNFGIPGAVKGGVQDAGAILDGMVQATGARDAATLRASTARAARSAGVNPNLLSGLYDPNLPALHTAADLLVYSAAEALAGQEGRSVTDADVKRFKSIVGDPRSLTANPQRFKSKLDTMEVVVNGFRQSDSSFVRSGAGTQGAPPEKPRRRWTGTGFVDVKK